MCIGRLPINNVTRITSSLDVIRYPWAMYQGWLSTPGIQVGRVNTGCIGVYTHVLGAYDIICESNV